MRSHHRPKNPVGSVCACWGKIRKLGSSWRPASSLSQRKHRGCPLAVIPKLAAPHGAAASKGGYAMRRIAIITLVVFAFTATLAVVASFHFKPKGPTFTDNGTTLTVNGTLAG